MPKAKKQKIYAIVDIETTGGMAKRDKITEIGIVIHDGSKIVDSYTSLINPERSIPPEITRITGITNSMVEGAPKFYEVAKEIVLRTEGAIFVAHNVRFDYSFIQEEFDKLGFSYSRKQLCTVKLSRKTFPGLRSYSLGNLISHFGIEVQARHRALDDAMATAKIFDMILEQSEEEEITQVINRGIKETKLPEGITTDKLHELPESAGVYYFYNAYGKVVYVGKSNNIRTRVMQHFAQVNAKSEKMIRLVSEIGYEITGSELIALLLESEEIKSLKPEINKSQRISDYPYIIYRNIEEDGFIHFYIDKVNEKSIKKGKVVSYFSSIYAAKSTLSKLRSEYMLCEEKIHAKGDSNKKCIFYPMGECLGACQGLEGEDTYNVRADGAAQQATKVFDQDYFIVVDGRNKDEKGVVLIKDNSYYGYGYINSELGVHSLETCIEVVEKRLGTIESNMIIKSYLTSKGDFVRYEI